MGPRPRLLHDDWRRTDDRPAPRSSLRVARTGHRRHPAHSRSRARQGYRRAGLPPLRAQRGRALRQDGAQRHRVRPHGGLRRRHGHPARRQRRQRDACRRCRDDPAPRACALSVRHQPRRRRRGVAARERHRLVAAGPHGHLSAGGSFAGASSRAGCPIPAKAAGRSWQRSTRPFRRRCSRRRCTRASARVAKRTSRTSCSRRCGISSADTWRKPPTKPAFENGERDGRHTCRCTRVLRGDGRSGLQEDLSVAAGDGQAREPRCARHRCGQGRLDP